MLLATGAVALTRKLKDDKRKKTEAKQGKLQIGDNSVARRAFASQTSTNKLIEGGNPGIAHTGTDIKFEDPSDVSINSPDTDNPDLTSPRPEMHDARHSYQTNVTSPVQSEKGMLGPSSPYNDTVYTPSDDHSLHPPAYSARPPPSSALSPSSYTSDTDTTSLASFSTNRVSITSSNSQGSYAIRIKTAGADLKSGFPYHPALFDLKVHPEKWAAFTQQIIDSTKLSLGDQAGAFAAATATALTGAISTSVWVGRSMTRAAQEKKVKQGLADSTDSPLGETLQAWNEDYFRARGIFVHLELSESAMKHTGQKSKTFRKSALFYAKSEDRDRKREERKFVVVVTKLDEDGVPSAALRELDLNNSQAVRETGEERRRPGDVPDGVVEIGGSDVPSAGGIVELPAEQVTMPVELPAEAVAVPKESAEPPSGFIEMSGDNSALLEKMHAKGSWDATPGHGEETSPSSREQDSSNPYILPGVRDGDATSATAQEEFSPQPLNVKADEKKGLYEGAEWGDESFA